MVVLYFLNIELIDNPNAFVIFVTIVWYQKRAFVVILEVSKLVKRITRLHHKSFFTILFRLKM